SFFLLIVEHSTKNVPTNECILKIKLLSFYASYSQAYSLLFQPGFVELLISCVICSIWAALLSRTASQVLYQIHLTALVHVDYCEFELSYECSLTSCSRSIWNNTV